MSKGIGTSAFSVAPDADSLRQRERVRGRRGAERQKRRKGKVERMNESDEKKRETLLPE